MSADRDTPWQGRTSAPSKPVARKGRRLPERRPRVDARFMSKMDCRQYEQFLRSLKSQVDEAAE